MTEKAAAIAAGPSVTRYGTGGARLADPPADREAEVARIAELIHDGTSMDVDGGVPNVCNRYEEHEQQARRLYDAGLRLAGQRGDAPLDADTLAYAIRRDANPNDPDLWEDPHDVFARSKAARLLEYARLRESKP